ncbi:MAG: hypothetical protein HOD68_01040 [Flavobacteriales bacterium]|nr:hypothetical protein [Flavobacteriales bacterium]
MKQLVLFFITLITFISVSYASFPIDNNIISANNDPTTDSWIPIIIVFWLLIISIPIIIIRFVMKKFKKK